MAAVCVCVRVRLGVRVYLYFVWTAFDSRNAHSTGASPVWAPIDRRFVLSPVYAAAICQASIN